jgi:hypothetical protein
MTRPLCLLLPALAAGALLAGCPARSKAPLACGPAVPGLAPLLEPDRVLLFGEVHGTREIPAFVGEVACQAVAAGLPVVLALEVPGSVGEAMDLYVRSDGEAARTRLLQSRHWSPDLADGRSSQAMLALVDRMRQLFAGGGRIVVIGVQRGGEAEGARSIVEARTRNPGSLVLALAGNHHTCVSPTCAPYRGFGHILVEDLRVPAVSLNAQISGGSFWGVGRAGRGVNNLGGRAPAPGEKIPRVEVWPEPRSGFHGVFAIGVMTASPPAGMAPP